MYEIDLTKSVSPVVSGHLRMGGVNPSGVEIGVNSRFFTMDGNPWLPVMGEMHFSRMARDEWEDEILKAKSGGINIVATYLFWIHHEEIESEWDWSGNKDIRLFFELCAKHRLLCYPRLGPWVHGEARNGGLPDWLLAKGCQTRCNDPVYLKYVVKWYQQIAEQLHGMLWKDGGPVIGIQLDNELTDQPDHLLRLKHIAIESGMEVPLYTVTGWGDAKYPEYEVLPMFGGYPDAFWDSHINGCSRDSLANYMISSIREDENIGADRIARSENDIVSPSEIYPFATCETGGGMQVSYHRRPFIVAGDVAAISLSKLASGSNLPGYYMYHGGSHPIGKLSYTQETQNTGYPNDLPAISYDFQAPLGEFGQVRESFHALRLLHMFLADFGCELAPMSAYMPETQPVGVDDIETLRWSVRSDGDSGFIFINNYQRVESLTNKKNVRLSLKLTDREISVPLYQTDILSDTYMIWPVNLDMNGTLLRYSTNQLICMIADPEYPCFVFFAPDGIEPEFAFERESIQGIHGVHNSVTQESDTIRISRIRPGTGCVFSVDSADGRHASMLVITEEQAMSCYKGKIEENECIILSSATVLFDGDAIRLQSIDPDISFSVFPAPQYQLLSNGKEMEEHADGVCTHYKITMPAKDIAVDIHQGKEAKPAGPVKIGPAGRPQAPDDTDFDDAAEWKIAIPTDALNGIHNAYLQIDYMGDAARAYIGDRLISDNFYNGKPWEIGLSRFAPDVLDSGITIKILPLREDAPIYIAEEYLPTFGDKKEIVRINKVEFIAEYEVVISTH